MSVVPTTVLPPVPPNIKNKNRVIREAFTDDKEKKSSAGKNNFMDKNEKKSSPGRIFKLFNGFCESTSLHGLGQVVSNKSYFVKFIWTFAFVAALAGNAYHLSNLIQTYLSYPVQQVTRVAEKSMPFPGVSICNLDALSKTHVATIFHNPKSKLAQVKTRLMKMLADGVISELDLMDYESTISMMVNIGADEAQQAGHSINDLIIRCTFRGMPCNIQKDFTQFFNPLLFNCYTFDPGNTTDNFSSIGQEYGLSLIIYLEATDGTQIQVPYNYFSHIANGIGARITINQKGSTPIPHYFGLDIMPGHSTTISYKVQQTKKLGEPYARCRSEETSDDDSTLYSPLICMGKCRQRVILTQCNCTTIYEPPLADPDYDQYPDCMLLPPGDDVLAAKTRAGYLKCMIDNWIAFEENFTRRGECECQSRCEEYKYPHIVSESKWPAEPYHQGFLAYELGIRPDKTELKAYKLLKQVIENPSLLNSGNHSDVITDNFARVNIFLSDTEVEVQEQQPSYMLSNLFSDIGGTMGLWVGLSILTVMELFQLCARLGFVLMGVNVD